MNGVIALCHFCEEHSASVVLATQGCNPPKCESSISNNSLWRKNNSPQHLIKQLVTYNAILGVYDEGGEPIVPPPACRSCSLILNDEPGLISHDPAQEVTYASVNYPLNPFVHTALQKACVQSLSEMSADCGPSYFCDEKRRIHVFSYGFYLKDLHARGQRSKFSILLLCPDELFLFNIWPFLDLNIGLIASRLQNAANSNFDKESHEALIRARASSAQRVSQRNYTGGACSNNTDLGSLSADARRQKRSEPRSIVDLTHIDQLFYRIHAWFTWLLRAANRRWNISSQNLSPPQLEEAKSLEEDSVDATPTLSPTETVLHPTDQQCAAFAFLQHLYQMLGPVPFAQLAQYVTLGHQVVVDASHPRMGELCISALAQFIPRACVKHGLVALKEFPNPFFSLVLLKHAQNSRSEPEERSKPLQLPSMNQPLILLQVESPELKQEHAFDELNQGEMVEKTQFNLMFNGSVPLAESNLNPVFRHTSQGELYEQAAEALAMTPQAENPTLYANPVGEIDISTLVSQFCELLTLKPQLEPRLLFSAFLNIKEEWLSKARLLHWFEKCQAPLLKSSEYRKKLTAILEALNCPLPQDEAVLRFYQLGLSKYSLNNVCHARKSRSSHMSRRTSCNSSGGNSFVGDSATTVANIQTFTSSND
ncbi:hypothetical protein Ciccas_009209 [Cichlidogyrus casuarinus]|uniref:UDENN FLCN/SMCR8-type domain-containing protein n=1 Tax=Cichlidogyrus casuarinus TaxID=1844966 RepID=A0ABD2PXQ3_9PLAT